ncbi:MAG: hypothetical protein ACI4I4_04105 [Acutalibacteraceae bacterium]
MRRIFAVVLSVLILSGVFALSACNNNAEQQVQNVSQKEKEIYPGLYLDYYEDGDTRAEAENNAVTGVGKDKINENFENSDAVESYNYESPLIYTFDNGLVAQYSVDIQMKDSGEKQNVTVLGYYMTEKQEDGSYRTYFISFDEMGQNDELDEKTMEKLLNEAIDQIPENNKKNESENGESSKSENSQSQQNSQPSGASSKGEVESVGEIEEELN